MFQTKDVRKNKNFYTNKKIKLNMKKIEKVKDFPNRNVSFINIFLKTLKMFVIFL